MKHIARHIILLVLILALLLMQLACAETSEVVQGIYDALVAEGTDYSNTKAMYMEYFPGTVFEETLEGDGFTVAISGSEYADGSWTFTRDGDALTVTIGGEDFAGMSMALSVIRAVGAYYGMNTSLISSYVNGLSALGIESDNFRMTVDEAIGNIDIRMNIAGPWDMKELEEMVFDEASLSTYDPLGENFNSMGGSIGRMMMVANGSVGDLTLLLGEYGGLDDLALRSALNIVNTLQPSGWEDFAANYTELADAEGAGWSVRLNVDDATVGEIIEDANAEYSYALIRFGSASSDEEEGEVEDGVPEPAEAPTAEEFAESYFQVIAGLETDTAGSTLKTAAAASEVCAFAEAHELYNPDVETLRANMLEAFEALSGDEQALFWKNFEVVRALLDDCLEDYDANRAAFEDAGVADAMDEIMYDPLNRLAWETLRNHTLTLGNDEDAG